MAKSFSPEYGSQIANLYELFLWYAYRCAMCFWTLSYVCDDSSSDGNYSNSPRSTGWFEESGSRKVGGFCDGVGNLKKIVRTPSGLFCQCGGHARCSGFNYPVANLRAGTMMGISFCSAVLVLKC